MWDAGRERECESKKDCTSHERGDSRLAHGVCLSLQQQQQQQKCDDDGNCSTLDQETGERGGQHGCCCLVSLAHHESRKGDGIQGEKRACFPLVNLPTRKSLSHSLRVPYLAPLSLSLCYLQLEMVVRMEQNAGKRPDSECESESERVEVGNGGRRSLTTCNNCIWVSGSSDEHR